MNRSESVNSSLSSCCSLDRSTKRSDVCRVFTGFARTLNGQTPACGRPQGSPLRLEGVRLACLSEPASCVRIRALAPQSHSGRVVDLRCVLTYPQLLAGTVADRVGTGGFETCPCRGPVSSLPQTGVSLFGCRYPCEKERLPLTRRFFWAPVPMRVGGGAWLLLWYMRCVMSSADWREYVRYDGSDWVG